jgi:hypothetical protein
MLVSGFVFFFPKSVFCLLFGELTPCERTGFANWTLRLDEIGATKMLSRECERERVPVQLSSPIQFFGSENEREKM